MYKIGAKKITESLVWSWLHNTKTSQIWFWQKFELP